MTTDSPDKAASLDWDAVLAALGPAFAEALALVQHVSASRAHALGWRPTRPGLLDDLRRGSHPTHRPVPGPA